MLKPSQKHLSTYNTMKAYIWDLLQSHKELYSSKNGSW